MNEKHEELVIELESTVSRMTDGQKSAFHRLKTGEHERGESLYLFLLGLGFAGIPDLHLYRAGETGLRRTALVLLIWLGGVGSCSAGIAAGNNGGMAAGGALAIFALLLSWIFTIISIIGFEDFTSRQRDKRILSLAKRIASQNL